MYIYITSPGLAMRIFSGSMSMAITCPHVRASWMALPPAPQKASTTYIYICIYLRRWRERKRARERM